MTQLSKQSQSNKVLASIYLAYQSFDLDVTETRAKVILNDLNLLDANESEIIEAIQLGRTGYFGKAYKISSNQICQWVREYLEQQEEKKTEKYNLEVYKEEMEVANNEDYNDFVQEVIYHDLVGAGVVRYDDFIRFQLSSQKGANHVSDYLGILSTMNFKGDIVYNLAKFARNDIKNF